MSSKALYNQRITVKDAILPDRFTKSKPCRRYFALGLCIGMLMGTITLSVIKSCDCDRATDIPPQTTTTTSCSGCHRQIAFTQYFRRNGSKSPEKMAHGVLQTRSPRLLASIAVVESGGNAHLRNTGYKKRHDGAFQVSPKAWGTVPTSAVEQALQAEAILEELTDKYPLRKALSVYGGDSTSRYQRKVLAELTRVP